MSEESKELQPVLVDQESISSLIYEVRGVKVMLDADLARIYGYETKLFNRQVKRNIEKFEGEDFMFQLTSGEVEILRCQNGTSSWGGSRYLPYAFTEQGVYMLMTVLKGELATKQTRALIRTFKVMKDYIVENRGLVGQVEYLQLSMQVVENQRDNRKLKMEMAEIHQELADNAKNMSELVTHSELAEVVENFSKPELNQGHLLLDGQPVEANLAYTQIYGEAKTSIFVVDNYIGLKTLVLLKNVPSNVAVTVFSDNQGKGLHQTEYQDFAKEYPNVKLTFKTIGGIVHDRYIILDYNQPGEKIYHCGGSSKDAGVRVTSIGELKDTAAYHPLINKLLKNPALQIK